MKKTILLISLLSCLFTTSIYCQGFFEKLAVEINFDLKSPQGILSDNGLSDTYGISAGVYYVGCNEKKIKFMPGYRFLGGLTKTKDGDMVALEEPQGTFAEERIINYYFGVEAVGRLVYDGGKWLRTYGEIYLGPRSTFGHERLVLEETLEGYSNSSQKLFSNTSTAIGIGLGALIELSDDVDLNLKAGTEYVGRVDHSDFNKKALYSTQKIISRKAFMHSFSIGIFIRPNCGKKCNDSRPDRRRTPSCYSPNNTIKKTTKIKRIKTK